MKKSLLAVSALACLALTLTGCDATDNSSVVNSGTASSDSSGNKATDIEAEIVWWNDYAEDSSSADTTRHDYVEGVIEEFNKIYPNITVTQKYVGSYSTIANTVSAGIATGDIPNIASMYADPVVNYESSGAVIHPEDYFYDEEIGFGLGYDEDGNLIEDSSTRLDDLNLSVEEEAYGDSDILTLPYSRSSEALYINDTVFEKVGAGAAGTDGTDAADNYGIAYSAPVSTESKQAYSIPTNYTELIALARQMKEDYPDVFGDDVQKDADGWFTACPFIYDSADNMFITFSKMLGIDYTDGDGSGVADQILFNNDEAKAMMVELKKLNNEGLICTADQLYMSSATYHQYSTSVFDAGDCFMLITSTTGGSYLAVDGFRASVNPTPTMNPADLGITTSASTGSHYAISQGPSLALFKRSDENINRATWCFYKFLTNTENTAGLAEATGYFPVRASASQTDTMQAIYATADAEITDTADSDMKATKKDKYIAQSYEVNETYTENDDYFMADVFSLSATTRTAVDNLVATVFNSTASTDEEIEAVVNSAFASAYTSVVTAA